MAASDLAKQFGLVALGGAVGSCARYAVTLMFVNSKLTGPWPVLAVNILGSFLIGLAAGHFSKNPNGPAQLLLVVGILGGFTTFSSFSLDNLMLLKQGAVLEALGNALVQCLVGLVLAALGFALTGHNQ